MGFHDCYRSCFMTNSLNEYKYDQMNYHCNHCVEVTQFIVQKMRIKKSNTENTEHFSTSYLFIFFIFYFFVLLKLIKKGNTKILKTE